MGPTAYILATLMLNAAYAAPPLEAGANPVLLEYILGTWRRSVAKGRPPLEKKPDEVVILEQENNFNGVDPWHWSYKTSDGQSREESGALTADGESVKLQGNYSYWSPDGILYYVTYTADDNHGFVPKIIKLVKVHSHEPGSYTWSSADGILHILKYTADDDNGFKIIQLADLRSVAGRLRDPSEPKGPEEQTMISSNAALSLVGRRK